MKLNYFQLAIVWLCVGVFGKIYDDAIDMYFIQHGTFFLELCKLILTGFGLLILDAPDIYTPLIIFSQFCLGQLIDYEAFLDDNYWCTITILISVYAVFFIYKNFKDYKFRNVLTTLLLFNVAGLPMLQTCATYNGPLIDYMNTHIFAPYFIDLYYLMKHFHPAEISMYKLILRSIAVVWSIICILFFNKFAFNIIHKCLDVDPILLDVTTASIYFIVGYNIVSVINLYYNLYVDNIHEKRKAKAEKRKAKAERRKAKAERRKLKAERRDKKMI